MDEYPTVTRPGFKVGAVIAQDSGATERVNITVQYGNRIIRSEYDKAALQRALRQVLAQAFVEVNEDQPDRVEDGWQKLSRPSQTF